MDNLLRDSVSALNWVRGVGKPHLSPEECEAFYRGAYDDGAREAYTKGRTRGYQIGYALGVEHGSPTLAARLAVLLPVALAAFAAGALTTWAMLT